MTVSEICFMTAKDLVERIRGKDLSVTEIMKAYLSQIDRFNPIVNAIVSLYPEQALDAARKADEALARGSVEAPLFGLPIAHKDLVHAEGMSTTFGSLAYKDFVADKDSIIVERFKRAGAISIGKTNTPEFGAGSQTFNKVFGETRNPFDTTTTCGGSSGGAAAAVACGMLPIADGSDSGGSIRNPASFCNVVGLRPSPGRIPMWPSVLGWFSPGVLGPLARTVSDTALFMSVISGPDPRSPIALHLSPEIFKSSLERDFRGVRIAWATEPEVFPVHPEVTETINRQRHVFENLGCTIVDSVPDFEGADEVFKIWRAWRFEALLGHLLPEHKEDIKSTLVEDIERGRKLTGPEIANAEKKRTEIYHRMRSFMEQNEFLIMPTVQVPPFDVKMQYVTEINGQKMNTYFDWMKSCYYISTTDLPAISVPCGFTDKGLPIGIQIIGRHLNDFDVLQMAFAFEKATEFWKIKPPIVFGPNN